MPASGVAHPAAGPLPSAFSLRPWTSCPLGHFGTFLGHSGTFQGQNGTLGRQNRPNERLQSAEMGRSMPQKRRKATERDRKRQFLSRRRGRSEVLPHVRSRPIPADPAEAPRPGGTRPPPTERAPTARRCCHSPTYVGMEVHVDLQTCGAERGPSRPRAPRAAGRAAALTGRGSSPCVRCP